MAVRRGWTGWTPPHCWSGAGTSADARRVDGRRRTGRGFLHAERGRRPKARPCGSTLDAWRWSGGVRPTGRPGGSRRPAGPGADREPRVPTGPGVPTALPGYGTGHVPGALRIDGYFSRRRPNRPSRLDSLTIPRPRPAGNSPDHPAEHPRGPRAGVPCPGDTGGRPGSAVTTRKPQTRGRGPSPRVSTSGPTESAPGGGSRMDPTAARRRGERGSRRDEGRRPRTRALPVRSDRTRQDVASEPSRSRKV